MLNNLDMAIAFAVVMLSVSLLVTMLVQGISAVLALRGANLRWGIEQLLRTVDPTISNDAARIAERVLHHPLISDSALSTLHWFEKIPLFRRYAIRLKLAKAVRVQELIGILDLLTDPTATAGGPPLPVEKLKAIVATVRRRVEPQVQTVIDQAAAVIAELKAAAAAPDMAVGGAGATSSGAPAGAATLAVTPAALQIDKLLDRVPMTAPLSLARDDISAWFDTMMDRVSQRFIMHARIWTVAFSIVVAFALHLDAFRLLSTFASNPDVRAQVAGASDALQRVAERTLQAQTPPAQPLPAGAPGVGHPADLLTVYREAVLKTPGVKPESVPGVFSDRPSAIEWLRTALADGGKNAAEMDDAVVKFNAAVDVDLKTDLDRIADQALTVRGITKTTGFQLVPDPYHSWDISPWWPTPVWAGFSRRTAGNFITKLFTVRPSNLHFWGILFSAGLLSLGAPFWFNALKSLSALKPIVANKAAQERQAR